jgi:PTH1 family peptidyl-tRNA hydrolase
MSFLIVGLGNIGDEYHETRHNIGFMVVDHLAEKYGVKFTLGKQAYVAEFKSKGKHFVLAKPTTYMNLSGKAVNYWMQQQKVELKDVLVITDDISLPFGKIRMKGKGSSGGHNGLTHIQETIQSDQYARMRFGVGSDFPKGRQVEYVLGKFNPDESKEIPALLERAGDFVLSFAFDGLERAMNKFNQ